MVVSVSLVGISSAAIVYVPDSYSSIQEAINAASVDDTVIISNGTYSENVELNKSLSLIGDGYPSVDAQQNGSAIRITVDGCVVIYVYNGKEYEGYMGNYWDDYRGKDEDGDGIGDTSYRINEPWDTGVEDDSDDYPLVLPFKDYF